MKKILFIASAMLLSSASVFAQADKAKQDEGAAAYKQFEGEMNKSLLQQPYDENTMYTGALNAFKAWFEADQIAETTPNAKGKIVNKNRKGNAKKLDVARPYLINGGVGCFNKDDSQGALGYFSTYCDCAENPMFAEYDYANKDTLLSTIGYYATMAASQVKNYDAVLKYAKYGVEDKENGDFAMQLKCQALKEQGKTDEWMAAINEGMAKFPKSSFYAGSMVDYYVSNGKFDEGIAYVDGNIAKDPNNYFNYYMKGYMLQSQKKYDEAAEVYKKATSLNNDFVSLYSFAGMNLVEKAGDMETNGPQYGKDGYEENMNKINEVLKEAMPYFEKARELAPDQTNLWKSALSTIYYRIYGAESSQYKGISE